MKRKEKISAGVIAGSLGLGALAYLLYRRYYGRPVGPSYGGYTDQPSCESAGGVWCDELKLCYPPEVYYAKVAVKLYTTAEPCGKKLYEPYYDLYYDISNNKKDWYPLRKYPVKWNTNDLTTNSAGYVRYTINFVGYLPPSTHSWYVSKGAMPVNTETVDIVYDCSGTVKLPEMYRSVFETSKPDDRYQQFYDYGSDKAQFIIKPLDKRPTFIVIRFYNYYDKTVYVYADGTQIFSKYWGSGDWRNLDITGAVYACWDTKGVATIVVDTFVGYLSGYGIYVYANEPIDITGGCI